MKFKTLIAASAAAVVATSASAAIVSFDVSGTLDDDGLSIHSAFDGAAFSGTIDVDTDVITAQTGAYVNYDISGYDVNVTSVGGDIISFYDDGEEGEDASALSVLPLTSALNFFIYENIDNPLTQGLERRFLRLNFLAVTAGPVYSLGDLLAEDPNAGDASKFELGLLQFSTSQFPTSIASATATTGLAVPAPVPLPAGSLLLLSGLAGVIGLKRQKKRAV